MSIDLQNLTPAQKQWYSVATHDGIGISDGQRMFAKMVCPGGIVTDEIVRRCRMITAAPELLAACKAGLERLQASHHPEDGITEATCIQMLGAIAKAEKGSG